MGRSMYWTPCILLVAILALIVARANATSTSVFDVQVNETNQISVMTGSGIRPTIGWTLLDNGGIRMTVAVKAINLGWLGLGISSSDGLGSSVMFGGKGGGAIIYRKGQISSPPVQEYSLLGYASEAVVPYNANPISISDVQKCIADFCVTQASVCLGQKLCSDALKCGQQKYTQLTSNVTSTGADPANQTVASALSFITQCASNISDPKNPDQVSAVAALLDAGGCVVSSCTRRILDKGLKQASFNTSTFSEDATTSTLQFILNLRQIAGIPFNPLSSTFMVAFLDARPGNFFLAHSPSQRAFASVNLDSAATGKTALPSWVLSHFVLVLLGFGLFLPLGIFLRKLGLQRFAWLPFLMLIIAISLAAIGSVVVSSILGTGSYNDAHSILGIVSIFAALLYFIFAVIQPPANESSDRHAWEKVALLGLKKNQIDLDNKRDLNMASKILVLSLELLTVGLAAGALFTGLQTVQNSTVQTDPSFPVIVIIAIVLLAASVILGYLGRVILMKRRSSGQTDDSSPSIAQSSSNPGFKSPGGEIETGVGDELDVIPLILSWEKVSFYAPPRARGGQVKQILNNAIGLCSPRTLTAVLGPSGAGKSSLMEILALRARRPPAPDSKIYINGAPAGSFPGIHRLMGYVPQHDVLHQYLTVLETLRFTARMILPVEMSEQAKVDRMLRVVAQLGIGHVLDTPVGGDTVRGLSGGERRRISIALQMLKSPSILFLDEPTSGLDAHLALRLVTVLRELANEGRTIFATIHQPSAACFELFDRVILMSGGYTVWSGSRTGALQFMREQNREVPPNWNPADWLLTVVDFKRDEQERIVQATETGQTVYKTDAQTESALRRKGIISGTMSAGFKSATSAAALGLDVSELRDNIKLYYLTVNPSKLKESPTVVEEIVSFALAKGLDALDKKLTDRYKASILPYFKPKNQRNLEPCTWDELSNVITNFASSKYSVELVERIRKAKEDARANFARLAPGLNAGRVLERLDSNGSFGVKLALDAGGETPSALLDTDDYAQPFMNQVRLLTRRSAILVWRNPQALKFQALQNVIFGVLLGALYSNVKFLKSSPFQQSIVMAIILAMVAFVTLSLGTQVAFNDRLVLEREMSDSMYSPIAHFVQRLLVGIPVAAFIAMDLILPAYFWVGLQPDVSHFFFFCLVNIAVVFLFDSVVFALTLLVSDVNSAYAIGNFYEAITIFFSGVFLPIYAMPNFFQWLYFLSPFAFAFGAVVVNEFQGTENEFSIAVSGVVIRSEWPNLIILFGMGLAWRIMGFIGIIRLFRQKRPGSLSWHQNEDTKPSFLKSPRGGKTDDVVVQVKSPALGV